jgi:hypothetical protein
MPLKPLDAPCWRLIDKTGADYDEGEGTSHFSTDAKAHRHAAEEFMAATAPTPKQWDRPCLLAFCDGCGTEFNDGVWGHTHFADEKTAHESVGLYDDYRVEPDAEGGSSPTCAKAMAPTWRTCTASTTRPVGGRTYAGAAGRPPTSD